MILVNNTHTKITIMIIIIIIIIIIITIVTIIKKITMPSALRAWL